MYSNVSDFIIAMSSGKMERISQSLTLFGNQGFQLTIFGILITLKSKGSSLRSQYCKMRLFLGFSNTVGLSSQWRIGDAKSRKGSLIDVIFFPSSFLSTFYGL